MKHRIWVALFLATVMAAILGGCSGIQIQKGDRKEINYTVMDKAKLPEELVAVIEENKKDEIRMSYRDENSLYLIRGYGQQKGGGYSIEVVECVEDEECVYFDTRLLGPKDGQSQSKEPSFPYIVVRMDNREGEIQIS